MEPLVTLLRIVPLLNGLHPDDAGPRSKEISGIRVCIHMVVNEPMLDRKFFGDPDWTSPMAFNRERFRSWPRKRFDLVKIILAVGIPRKVSYPEM